MSSGKLRGIPEVGSFSNSYLKLSIASRKAVCSFLNILWKLSPRDVQIFIWFYGFIYTEFCRLTGKSIIHSCYLKCGDVQESLALRSCIISDSNRISTSVALVLLETIRETDQPTEILKEEDISATMPRRLGLSQVVLDRIDGYQKETKRGRKIADVEFKDLVGLVNKRPDAVQIFLECGQRLAPNSFLLPKVLSGLLVAPLARRRIYRCLIKLFGRRIGGFAGPGLTLECRSHLFMEVDPGGSACSMVSGICLESARGLVTSSVEVKHVACESRGDAFCRWDVQGI